MEAELRGLEGVAQIKERKLSCADPGVAHIEKTLDLEAEVGVQVLDFKARSESQS